MDELQAQMVLETMQDAGRATGCKLKELSNGDFVIVTGQGLYLWSEQDAKKWIRGSLQRAIERKLKKEEAVGSR